MNKKSIALIDLLKQYAPTDGVLTKEASLQQILHSPDYLKLQKRTVFAPYFEKHFSRHRLEGYSQEKLEQIREALPVIPTALEDLVYSINNGAGPQLLPEDRPDFTNKKSLVHIIELLHESSGKNYSNIPPEEFMQLFEESTVKRLGGNFADMPFECQDYEGEIARLFPDQYYCISESEIEKREQALHDHIDQLREEKARLKSNRRLYRLFKLLIGLCIFLIPSIVAGITGALSSSALAVCTLVEVVLILIFWIRG